MLEDEDGYLMAVTPASHHIELGHSVVSWDDVLA
jgi:hypothetical protein